MTSKHVDQFAQEESPPTVPAHPLGDPTEAATRGNIREGTNLDGNSREAKAAHGSLTRLLADLAKSMFTHQEPYREPEGSDPLDPNLIGEPPGRNLATTGSFTQHLAAHGNFRRHLASYDKSLPAQGSAYHAIEGNLPYSTKGYLAVTTFGVTKEITANSQDPDQTSRRPNHSLKDLSAGAKKTSWRITTHHMFITHLPNLVATVFLPNPPYFQIPFTTSLLPSYLFYHLPHFHSASLLHHHQLNLPSHFPYLSPSFITPSIFLINNQRLVNPPHTSHLPYSAPSS